MKLLDHIEQHPHLMQNLLAALVHYRGYVGMILPGSIYEAQVIEMAALAAEDVKELDR